jgi:hypothetical protein
MSRSIDLFIDAPPGLDDLSEHLAELTGLAFEPIPGTPRRVLRSGGVTVELADHDFVDDRDLLFSRYRYVLTAVVPAGQSVNESGEAALLRQVFAAVKADNRFGSLLVFDLQHLMDRSAPLPAGQVPE